MVTLVNKFLVGLKAAMQPKKITISHGYGTATFTGFTSSAKYYVCFEVPTNSNRYSFDGNIS